MKRFSERLLLGGFLGGTLVLASASCSSSSDSSLPGNTGNSTSTGTAGSGNHGGSGNVGTAGSGVVGTAGSGVVGTAGTGTGTTGGTSGIAGGTGTAGTSSTAGAGGGTTAMCVVDPDLIKAAGTACFVGCDPASTADNPQGIQGAFYAYGDGDGTPTGAKSCSAYTNPPCTAQGLCLSGTTHADMDYAMGWGCGVGLDLNATGGTPSVKSAYTGPVGCFQYTLTGNSGGNEVRIGFPQSATPGSDPYISVNPFTNGATGTACIKDATCHGDTKCTPPSATAPQAYAIHFAIAGGNHAGTYNFCLSSLTPVTSGATTLTPRCGLPSMPNQDVESVGKYDIHNNVNGATNGSTQCVLPTQSGTSAGFTINMSNLTPTNQDAPAAYPSLVDGWHYGVVSNDPALPKAISALTSANSSVTFTGSASKYDAAYDIWVLPHLPSASISTPDGGLEIMVWLNRNGGANPAGSNNGQNDYQGYTVNTGTVSTWNYVAFVAKTGTNTFNGNLKDFITEGLNRMKTKTTPDAGGPWLAGIEFGFELYSSGNNLAVTSYSLDVK